MKLKQNSISAKLYRWFYITDSMPANLCPYFWKLVAMWVLIGPAALISAPMLIANKGDEIDEWTPRIIGGILLYALSYIALLMIFAPISYLMIGMSKQYLNFQVVGFIAWATGIVCLIIFLIVKKNEKRKVEKARKKSRYIWDEEGNYGENPDYEKFEPKTPRTYILKEFIKARYNRYCPKIDWE
jgi:hypothetical protein